MHPQHLKKYIIEPVLYNLGYNQLAAINLLLGTAAQESRLGQYLHQLKGPALGIYQMEPNTYNDICENYLYSRPKLSLKIYDLQINGLTPEKNLIGNLYYATALARIHYLRFSEPLPDANDIRDLAKYWKKYYNTRKGKGTIEQFVDSYNKLILRI